MLYVSINYLLMSMYFDSSYDAIKINTSNLYYNTHTTQGFHFYTTSSSSAPARIRVLVSALFNISSWWMFMSDVA